MLLGRDKESPAAGNPTTGDLPTPAVIPVHVDASVPNYLIPATDFHLALQHNWVVGSRFRLPALSKDGGRITGTVRRILLSRDRAADLAQEREARTRLCSIRRDELAWAKAERAANADKPGPKGGRKKTLFDDDDVDYMQARK